MPKCNLNIALHLSIAANAYVLEAVIFRQSSSGIRSRPDCIFVAASSFNPDISPLGDAKRHDVGFVQG